MKCSARRTLRRRCGTCPKQSANKTWQPGHLHQPGNRAHHLSRRQKSPAPASAPLNMQGAPLACVTKNTCVLFCTLRSYLGRLISLDQSFQNPARNTALCQIERQAASISALQFMHQEPSQSRIAEQKAEKPWRGHWGAPHGLCSRSPASTYSETIHGNSHGHRGAGGAAWPAAEAGRANLQRVWQGADTLTIHSCASKQPGLDFATSTPVCFCSLFTSSDIYLVQIIGYRHTCLS